jgi:hypothetical protein
VHDPLDPVHDRREVDREAVDLDPELGSAANVLCDLGGPDQGLGRDAPDVDSGAAEMPGLEQGDGGAEPARSLRRRPRPHPAAEDGEVEPFRHGRSP